MKAEMISQDEAEKLLVKYERFMQTHRMTFAPDRKVVFLVRDDDLMIDDDGIVWMTTEIGLGPHSFIEIVTGEEKNKRILLLLCLVNPRSRLALTHLLKSTIDPGEHNFTVGATYRFTYRYLRKNQWDDDVNELLSYEKSEGS